MHQTEYKYQSIEALEKGNLEEAYQNFKKAGFTVGEAYCKFLSGETEQAKVILNLIKGSSSFAEWLLSLISIIENKNFKAPTYFQIRNYYEQDLEMLFKYDRKSYIKKIMENQKYLEKYNKEIYKYSARVLKNNRYNEIAKNMLQKSLDIFYNDPETHYMLGEIYEEENKYKEAISEYKKANEPTGEYIPAKNKLKKLTN